MLVLFRFVDWCDIEVDVMIELSFSMKVRIIMLSLSIGGISVEINLENGVYTAGIYSATGKTYLYSLLRKYAKNIAVAVTYDDLRFDIDIEKEIEKVKPKLVLFDRYAMYEGRFDKLIEKIANSCIVIVDYKNEGNLLDISQDVKFTLTEDKLEVTAYE